MSIILASLIIGLVGTGRAQIAGVNISTLPQCAQSCLAMNSNSATGCAVTDIACFCKSVPYINTISCCLQKSCNAADQKTAIAFDIALCDSYNVSIPNFLGCSPLESTFSYQPGAATAALPTTLSVTALATIFTVKDIQPAFTTTDGGPVATFTGSAILTGSCTAPQIATLTMTDGNLLMYPWVGCSNENAGCCPFNLKSQGPLTVCPADYFTTAGACCPSGWAVFTSPIAGQIPCVTTPALGLVANTIPTGAVSVITTQLLTVRYNLYSPARLSTGGIVGIVIGSVAGVLVFALIGTFIFRARQRHAQKIRNATMTRSTIGTGEVQDFSPTSPASKRSQAFTHIMNGPASITDSNAVSELPSLLTKSAQARSESAFYANSPTSAAGSMTGFLRQSPVASPRPVMELPGSTYLHEHHPVYAPPRLPAGKAAGQLGGGGTAD